MIIAHIAAVVKKRFVATPMCLNDQQRLPRLSGLKPRTEPRLRLGSGALTLALAARFPARRTANPALVATSHRGTLPDDRDSDLAASTGGRARRGRGLSAHIMVDAPQPRRRRGVVRGEGPEKLRHRQAFQFLRLTLVFPIQQYNGDLL